MQGLSENELKEQKPGILTKLEDNPYLLVSFGGIRQGLGIPSFEFFNSLSSLNCDKIFIRDFHQAWYQKGIDDNIDSVEKIISYLRNIITENKYKKVCFLGNSMGGYAAILFGSILKVDCVFSFAPQSFIDKWNRAKYFDKRWIKEIREIYRYKYKRTEFFDLKKFLKTLDNNSTKIVIYYSSSERIDRIHAERLDSIPSITLRPKENGDHQVIKSIRDSGELIKIMTETFNPTS